MYSPTKQKILALLASGLVVGLSASPRIQWQIIKNIPKTLKNIDTKILNPCDKEIKFLAEFFEVGQHVRVLTVENISIDADLKLHFEFKLNALLTAR